MLLPSNTIPDKSNAKGSFVQSQKLTASESFEDRLKTKMSGSADIERFSKDHNRLDGKIRARQSAEERLRRKMGQSSGKLLPSSDGTVSRYQGLLMRKMNESVLSESRIMHLESFEDCDDSTTASESQKHTVRETFQQRMEKKTSESHIVPAEVDQTIKSDEDFARGLQAQWDAPMNATPPIESQKITTELGSYEGRIKMNIGGYATVPTQKDSLEQFGADASLPVSPPLQVKNPRRLNIRKAFRGKVNKSLTRKSIRKS